MANAAEINKVGTDCLEVRPVVKREVKDALSREIVVLKKKLNAIILAHNYQVPEIQDIADFVGDSLGLSRQASKTDADVIVFCGVHFMAEQHKDINPDKLVILPDENAGCSLEESCPPDKLKELQDNKSKFLHNKLYQL
jgi:quinolinate synthase